MRRWFIWGGVLAALGVAAGAFGAHGLRGRVEPDLLEVFNTGARYHLIHALGLFVVGVACDRFGKQRKLAVAGWLLVAGVVLFSGSLYVLAITGVRWIGAITPLGGVAFIAAWVCIALGAATGKSKGLSDD